MVGFVNQSCSSKTRFRGDTVYSQVVALWWLRSPMKVWQTGLHWNMAGFCSNMTPGLFRLFHRGVGPACRHGCSEDKTLTWNRRRQSCQQLEEINTSQVSLMIPSARPTIPPAAKDILTWKWFRFKTRFWKVGTDGRTDGRHVEK